MRYNLHFFQDDDKDDRFTLANSRTVGLSTLSNYREQSLCIQEYRNLAARATPEVKSGQ
ncbi:MAG: hypothetical protein ACJ70V_05815 [Nitrososphaera sp.]